MKTDFFDINGVKIKKRTIPDLPKPERLKKYSRENRKAGNLAEVVFWKQVHKKKFHEIDFNRQFVIGNYIADFYARSLGLVVEVDGGYHVHRTEYDAKRDDYMRSLGIKIFRVSDEDVLHRIEAVKRRLEGFVLENFEAVGE